MAQADKQNIENEKSKDQLSAMNLALKIYKQALAECQLRQHQLSNELSRYGGYLHDAQLVERGQSLPYVWVPHVWIAIQFFMGQPSSTVGLTEVPDNARSGPLNFSHNLVNKTCDDVPKDKTNLFTLVPWLAGKNYMPISKSPAYDLFVKMLSIVALDAKTVQDTYESKLEGARKELADLRSKAYPTVGIGTQPAKSTSPGTD